MTARRAALLAVAALLAASCGRGRFGPALTPTTVRMPDGRVVECIRYKQGYAGGLSCDWANAR